MMKTSISAHQYMRKFINPLRTAKGVWSTRYGILLELTHDSKRTWVDIAPIPNFGTETFTEAIDFISNIGKSCDLDSIEVPKHLSCCEYGISSARYNLKNKISKSSKNFPISALLDSGISIKDSFLNKKGSGFNVFKFKIGVNPFEKEWEICKNLAKLSNPNFQFRLDANAGLDYLNTEKWFRAITDYNEKNNIKFNIEFFEQPMAVGLEEEMAKLGKKYKIQIALDESLNGATGKQWLKQGEWLGPLIIKPSLQGSFEEQLKILKPLASQCVISSAFETSVGYNQSLIMASFIYSGIKDSNFAIGFDTQTFFGDIYELGLSRPYVSISETSNSIKKLVSHVF